MHSNEVKEYEITYAIGEKVYKEKNFVILANQLESDFCFGEKEAETSDCIQSLLYTLGLFCASGVLTGTAVFGLATGSQELAVIGGVGGTISYMAIPCVDHCNHYKATAKVITAQPKLQNLPVDYETIIMKVEGYNGKQSFVKFLEGLEESKDFKIYDIIKRSRLIIEVPNVVINKYTKQDVSLYKKYQMHSLFKKYSSAHDRFVLRAFFSIIYKERYSSGYVEYININNEMLKYTTNSNGEQYQIEELNIRKNYVIIKGDMILTGRWASTVHEGKKNKIINKEEKISIVVSANGDIKVEDKYLKAYQKNNINIDYGANDLFIGGIPFSLAITCGRWKNAVRQTYNVEQLEPSTGRKGVSASSQFYQSDPMSIILEEPSSSMQQVSAKIGVVTGVRKRVNLG